MLEVRGKGVARKFTEGRRFRETNYPPFPAPKPKGGSDRRDAKRGKTQEETLWSDKKQNN